MHALLFCKVQMFVIDSLYYDDYAALSKLSFNEYISITVQKRGCGDHDLPQVWHHLDAGNHLDDAKQPKPGQRRSKSALVGKKSIPRVGLFSNLFWKDFMKIFIDEEIIE